jgi:hypothetical protein
MANVHEVAQIMENVGDVTKAIVAFSNSPEYRELDAFYGRKSTFEILGIQRNEARHSRFIAWLLDPEEFHELGHFTLKKFLEACVLVGSESRQCVPSGELATLLDELIVGRVRLANAIVETELPLKTELPLGKGSRIDIHINCQLVWSTDVSKRLTILIENKVDSDEHDSQTIKYRDWLTQNPAKYDYSLPIYLTPLPTLKLTAAGYEAPECVCKEFLQINYQYLVNYLIEPALSRTQSEQARDFISDYLRALSAPSMNAADKQNRGDAIMAISEHARKMLTAFWKKHHDLILAASYATSIDLDQPEELRDQAGEVYRSLSTKDYSPYSIVLDGSVVAPNVKKTAIGREVARVLIGAGITEPDFAKLRADKSSGFALLKQESEITAKELEYNRYRVGHEEPLIFQGKKYHASGNWGEINLPNFKDFLAQNFPMIQLNKQDAEP